MASPAALRILGLLVLFTAGCLALDVQAGTSATLQLPANQVTLVSAGADAPDSFLWSVPPDGLGPVSFSNPTAASTKFAMIHPGTYTIALALTFPSKPSTTLTTTVTLAPNPWRATNSTTALEFLRNQVAGIFRAGHSLPPLTGMIAHHIPLLLEMADRWGYALNLAILPNCTADPAKASGPPLFNGNNNDEILAIALNGNGRHKISGGAAGILPGYAKNGAAFLQAAAASGLTIPESVWLHNDQGTRLPSQTNPSMSPLAPESWVRERAAPHGECAQRISRVYPISLLTSNGEYGPPLYGWGSCNYLNDPDVLVAAGYPNQADPSCYQNASYANASRDAAIRALISARTALFERIIREVVANVTWAGNASLYGLYSDAYGQDRGRWNGWASWMYDFADTVREGVSTVPNPQIYFNDNNGGWGGLDQLNNPSDMTWKMLNDVGGAIRFGFKNFFPWISAGGYAQAGFAIAEQDRWIGFLKIMFTAGALGGSSGYFNYDGVYEQQVVRGAPIGTTLPIWLRQYMDISRVQAFFSYFEDYLRNGDLVAGSYTHFYNVLTAPIPLYCLDIVGEPQGKTRSPGVYVLARRRTVGSATSWLLTAWAQQGSDRNVTAVLPDAGNLTVNARVAGSVYVVTKSPLTGEVSLSQIDPDPMNPAALFFGDSTAPALIAGRAPPGGTTNTATTTAAATGLPSGGTTAASASAAAAAPALLLLSSALALSAAIFC